MITGTARRLPSRTREPIEQPSCATIFDWRGKNSVSGNLRRAVTSKSRSRSYKKRDASKLSPTRAPARTRTPISVGGTFGSMGTSRSMSRSMSMTKRRRAESDSCSCSYSYSYFGRRHLWQHGYE